MNQLTTWSQVHTVNPYKDFSLAQYPKDVTGWHSDDPIFAQLINEVRPKTVIEVGVWKGASTLHMASCLKRAGLHVSKIMAVDTFLGSLEFWTRRDDPERYQALKCINGYPTVYRQFLANVLHAGAEEIVIPFPNTSVIAARWFRDAGFEADLIYIDGSHEYDEVSQDLNYWWDNLRPGGVMFGDDWETWAGVRAAVTHFIGRLNVEYRESEVVRGNKWIINKP